MGSKAKECAKATSVTRTVVQHLCGHTAFQKSDYYNFELNQSCKSAESETRQNDETISLFIVVLFVQIKISQCLWPVQLQVQKTEHGELFS